MGFITVLDFTTGKVNIHEYKEIENECIEVDGVEYGGADDFISVTYRSSDTQFMCTDQLRLQIH